MAYLSAKKTSQVTVTQRYVLHHVSWKLYIFLPGAFFSRGNMHLDRTMAYRWGLLLISLNFQCICLLGNQKWSVWILIGIVWCNKWSHNFGISCHKCLAFFMQALVPLPHASFCLSSKLKSDFTHFLQKNQYFSTKNLYGRHSPVRQHEMMTNTANYSFKKVIRKKADTHKKVRYTGHRVYVFRKNQNHCLVISTKLVGWSWKCNKV